MHKIMPSIFTRNLPSKYGITYKNFRGLRSEKKETSETENKSLDEGNFNDDYM